MKKPGQQTEVPQIGPSIWAVLESILGVNFYRSNKIKTQVLKLSGNFTENRSAAVKLNTQMPQYFNSEEAAQGYLAYFLPLNFFKLFRVFRESKSIFELEHIKDKISILDYGCGPATATVAFLMYYCKLYGAFPKHIQVTLVDKNETALELAEQVLATFSKLCEKAGFSADVSGINSIEIQKHLKLSDALKTTHHFDVSLAANILNELPAADSPTQRSENGTEVEPLLTIWEHSKSLFILEPAHRVASQRLIRLRKRLLDYSKKISNPIHILAPCSHHGNCPLYRSKFWCHFSEKLGSNKASDEEKLIQLNKWIFQNPRLWLKFSYLVLLKEQPGEELTSKQTYRAIGDLHPSGAGFVSIDLCQADTKKILKMSSKDGLKKPYLVRGRLIRL